MFAIVQAWVIAYMANNGAAFIAKVLPFALFLLFTGVAFFFDSDLGRVGLVLSLISFAVMLGELAGKIPPVVLPTVPAKPVPAK